ncbi:MAG: S-layer homology domain-containing protein, partial [Clostridia bacterium]|nr:S-layer homology domain-containing protein [Clostridia bacterium]
MKKQCIVSVCLALLITLSATLWVSAGGITIEIDNLTEVFTVSGTVEESVRSGKASLKVVSDDGYVAHVAEVRTDEEGSFTYSFKMDTDVPSGYYTAYASAYGREGQAAYNDRFEDYYVGSVRKGIILDDINDITSKEALKLYLTANNEKVMQEIGIYWPTSLALSQTAKDKIYADLFNGRSYAELMDLKELFYNNVAIYALNEATEENVVAVWNEYNYDTTGALMDGLYQGYSSANKNGAIVRMAGEPVTGQEDIIKNFNAAVFLQEIYLSSSYSDINKLFAGSYVVGSGDEAVTRYYKDAVTFSLATFNRLDSVTRGNALYGKSYMSMADLETAINGITTPGPGGGGGGGSSDDSDDLEDSDSVGGGFWGITNEGQGEMIETNPQVQNGFKDISKDFWAYEAITSLVEKGVISGYLDNTFKPNNDITREEFITILAKYLNLDTNANCDFADVSKSRWSYSYIAAAYNAGIITGNDMNMF